MIPLLLLRWICPQPYFTQMAPKQNNRNIRSFRIIFVRPRSIRDAHCETFDYFSSIEEESDEPCVDRLGSSTQTCDGHQRGEKRTRPRTRRV